MTVAVAGPVMCRPRRPIEMAAWQVTEANVREVARWAGAWWWAATEGSPTVWLPDEHGARVVPARPGDFVVRTSTGHFVRVSAADFESFFEVVEEGV